MAAADNPLARVLWIGGGSGGGKSTVATRLAADHDLAVYHADEELSALVQGQSFTSSDAPLLHRFLAMDMDERWVNRSPREMLETFHWFQGEGFERLIDDVRSRAVDRPLVVEGFHLLPRLLAPLLPDRRRAVWLLPTPGFRQQVLRRRLALDEHFVQRTSDPERALANLGERDHLFTEQVRAEVATLGLTSIDVDGSQNADALAARLAKGFGLV